jgi:hypothetical protein
MHRRLIVTFLAGALILAACTANSIQSSQSDNPPASKATPTQAIFKTPVGELLVSSSRFVEEVNGVTPAEGCKLLLVMLARPDNTAIDVQQFQEARMQIFIRGEDGTDTLSTMGGLVEGKFAIGFQIPEATQSYTLVWGENPPLNIIPGG